jgi:phosphonatase-like hydrolase
MAGTTFEDGASVLEAFERVLDLAELDGSERVSARSYVVETMGQSKIEVFTHLFGERARDLNLAFEELFREVVDERGVREIPGVRPFVEDLIERGVRVGLTTGFSPETRELLVERLGWNDLFKVRVSPVDAGRGRPFPDMIWHCARELAVTDITRSAAFGDTPSDITSARRAGVGLVVGVLSGTGTRDDFAALGVTHVLASVADSGELLANW